ncbi:MAG: CinA family nicotinamide mononucleotide deamidase-related protein [Acidobacteriota bacterium]|nr:CinA family nicotinamide mononucleotide deamidase-related protein [Acidobacteriota bacterium]
MRAAIVAVGSELLGTDRLDTNSLRLTEELGAYGVVVSFKCVVADDLETLADEIERLVVSFDLVLVTGGLGPTEDDLTREAVARALGQPLERRAEIVAEIEAKFEYMRMPMPEVNRKQADVIGGARVIANPRGTAPGLLLENDNATLFLFPGVPSELEGMIKSDLVPWLAARHGGGKRETRTLKVACVPESTAEERLRPFYDRFGRQGLSILASPGQVTLQLTCSERPEARAAWLEERSRMLREVFGASVFSECEEGTLEEVVGSSLRAIGAKVVTAESCTGGLVSERLTRIAGSSDFFLGGVVTYSDELKSQVLGVEPATLERYGAVSKEVVGEMAAGARRLFGADYCLAVSGIAGPGGGSAEKPVGTVCLALAGSQNGIGLQRRLVFPGDRERVRWLSSQWALDMLRLDLENSPQL